jgi:hypothetical protein
MLQLPLSRGRFGDKPLSSAPPSSQTRTADTSVGKSHSLNLLLAAGSILFALLLAEIVFRLAMGLPVFKFVNWRAEEVTVDNLGERALFDPVLGWVLRNNYRSAGFNTLDHGIRRNATETTIRTGAMLAVGDSFTEGWDEVRDNETWPAYLEGLTGQPVVNGANGGFGTDQIILRIEQLLPIVRPKTLLIGFHELDILKAAYSAWGVSKPYFTIEDGTLHYHPPQPLERRQADRERGVETRPAVRLPPRVERGDGQRRFRVEEVVKAALLDPGSIADGIHGHRVVARLPGQLGGRVHQALFGVADSSHTRISINGRDDS